MSSFGRRLFLIVLAGCLVTTPVMAEDVCSICGKRLNGTIYMDTDKVTGIEQMVCFDCLQLPSCFICGLPVNNSGIELADGRHLCARDGKTAVLTASDASRVASEVRDRLDKFFSRFASFPTNVDVTVLDRIDVDRMYQPGGYDFESPNLLGCIEVTNNAGHKRYTMRLLTGLPLMELRATAAHEFSHAWVGENVPAARREKLSRNAEEGFCELVAYLLMDSESEADQKAFILKNHYTRGQVDLFIAAERRFGFDQILDWMQYGETAELESGQLGKIREVTMPAPVVPTAPIITHTNHIALLSTNASTNLNVIKPALAAVIAPPSDVLKLQGIMWGNRPAAIINRHTVYIDDRFKVKMGNTETIFRCVEIQKSSVRVENVDSGHQEALHL